MTNIVQLRPRGSLTQQERDNILATTYSLSARGCECAVFDRTDENDEYASIMVNGDRAFILGRNERGFYLTEDGQHALSASPSLATVLERLAAL